MLPDDARAGIKISRAAREQAVSLIHAEIDGYLGAAFGPRAIDPGLVKLDLTQIFVAHHGDSPSAFTFDQGGQRDLLVTYVIGKGTHGAPDGTAVTIRAYKAVEGQLRLIDATGEDMNGAYIFLKELKSPRRSEEWLLAWGAITGSNGLGVFLVRVYAFDGRRFTTVWSPGYFAGADAKVTTTGFTLRHLDRERTARGAAFVEDEYRLTSSGIRLVNSAQVAE